MYHLSKREMIVLESVKQHTAVTLRYNNEITSYCDYVPHYAEQRNTCERLNQKGFLVRVAGCYELTLTGWQVVKSSPIQKLIEEMNADYNLLWKREIAARPFSGPNYSYSTVKYYRELYKNPDMTECEIHRLERERVFENRLCAETEMQELEHKIACLEARLQFHPPY